MLAHLKRGKKWINLRGKSQNGQILRYLCKKGHRLEKSAQPPPVVTNISYAIDFEVPHKLFYIALPLFNLLQMCGEILSLKNQKILSFPKIPSSFSQRRPSNPYNWRHSSCKFSRGLPALALFLCSYQEIQCHCHLFITMIVAIVIITIITVIFITNLITFDKTRPYSGFCLGVNMLASHLRRQASSSSSNGDHHHHPH